MGIGIIVCGLNGSGKSTLGKALSRAEQEAEEWAKSLNCPIIRVDGTKSIEKNITLIVKQL